MQSRILTTLFVLLFSLGAMTVGPYTASGRTLTTHSVRFAEAIPEEVPATRLLRKSFFKNLLHTRPVKTKNKDLAALLAILAGYLGIHRFYLGYLKQGIMQLLMGLTVLGCVILVATTTAATPWIAFTIGFILGAALIIWQFADFCRIITGSLKPRKGGYKE
jgi:TM2 domain-containing membrane protein YozV